MFNKIIYVARGMVVEKNGELEDFLVPQLKFTKGMIAGLQNLLPDCESEEQISDIYCHPQSIASVEQLDLTHLKLVLSKDGDKLLKLWNLLAHRMIVIHHNKLTQFQTLT